MSGATLIGKVQAALAGFLIQYATMMPPGLTAPTSGAWDATTARIALLLVTKTGVLKNAYNVDYIDSAWGEYYKHRFDIRLTTLILALLANSDLVIGQIEDALGMPRSTLAGSPVEGVTKPDLDAELSHDVVLPRWDTTPRGSLSETFVRRV